MHYGQSIENDFRLVYLCKVPFDIWGNVKDDSERTNSEIYSNFKDAL